MLASLAVQDGQTTWKLANTGELAMMAGVATTCEECEGRRFDASVLDYHLGGRDISEVLAMPVCEALEFFGGGDRPVDAPCRCSLPSGGSWPGRAAA